VGNVTLPKAVLSTVKIFAVYEQNKIAKAMVGVKNVQFCHEYFLSKCYQTLEASII